MKKFKDSFTEQKEKYVILLPGGYKPPTKGHLYMIKSYNTNPLVHKVIVLIGPKEREGVTRDHSLQIFKLYGIDKLSKVVVEDTKFDSPMVAGFDFVEKDPRAEQYKGMVFGIGASNKGDDAVRAEKFVSYFNNNPSKLRPGLSVAVPPIVDALVEDGSTISATDLRRAIRETDVNTIRHLIPPEVDVKDFISIFNK